jgi:hypothetical protein
LSMFPNVALTFLFLNLSSLTWCMLMFRISGLLCVGRSQVCTQSCCW